jgi:CBS domain containing-hemolysin-like protein
VTDEVGSKFFLYIYLLSLLAASFLFSAMETAMTAVSKARLAALEEANPHRRRHLSWLASHRQRALTVTLVGNNLVNISASAIASAVAVSLVGGGGIWISVLLMTVVIVFFCEILPKASAIARPDGFLLNLLPVIRLLNFLLWPVISLVQWILTFLGRTMGIRLDTASLVTREEIDHMVKEGSASGALEEEERKMIHGIISFEETRVSEIMVPRTDVVAVVAGSTVRDAIRIFMDSGHSRMPIYEGDMDHVVGILYVKDLLRNLTQGDMDRPVEDCKRDCLFVPETMRIGELFDRMKKARVHMAVVVDEYGGTAGLVTLEDLLEEIVGEIQDEYDEEIPPIQEEGGVFVVQGHVHLEDLSEALGHQFQAEDVDTVAGFVLSILGAFPEEGQGILYDDWSIEVTKVQGHRIMEVRFRRLEDRFGGDEDD